ncbi:uncharacterized protein LOC124374614, partial [Homalodisca vitripennis]|uniref:uncharacterized protein LOC124374614 n=1 Tax=Homalodisca vitripennis TaxID=197043 RepID=UPI001EEB2DBF
GAVDIEKAIKLLNKCKKETGATENVEEMIKTKKPFLPLLKEKLKMRGLNTKAISDFMEAKYADTPEKLEKAAETLAKCSTI